MPIFSATRAVAITGAFALLVTAAGCGGGSDAATDPDVCARKVREFFDRLKT